MGGWGCPHNANDICLRVEHRPCDPGMKGCVLSGRFLFSDPAKNTRRALRDKAGRRSTNGQDRRRR